MAIDLGYDESGHGDTLLVSMQLSVVEQAKKFRRQWRNRLRDDDLKFFHSKEFGNYSHGVFSHLSRDDRARLLHDLGRITRRHLYVGITAKVTKSLYEQKTTPLFRSKWGSPYTFAIQTLVVSAYIFAEQIGIRPEFNILIEDGHANAAQAVAALNEAKRAGIAFAIPSRILTVGLGSKADHPILQAADMLGYSEWQRMTDKDMDIYNVMHADDMIYLPEFVDLDPQLIDILHGNAERWMESRKEWGRKKYEARKIANRVREIQPNNEAVDESSTQRNQGQTGCGESSEKGKVKA
jgi:hypothetical protein